LIESTELPPRLAPVVKPGDHTCVLSEERPDLFRCFAQEVDAESGNTKLAHSSDVFRAALWNGVVDRVPAPGVRNNWEQRSDPIAQLDRVPVARAPTVSVIFPGT
jgi:hypothetical protein